MRTDEEAVRADPPSFSEKVYWVRSTALRRIRRWLHWFVVGLLSSRVPRHSLESTEADFGNVIIQTENIRDGVASVSKASRAEPGKSSQSPATASRSFRQGGLPSAADSDQGRPQLHADRRNRRGHFKPAAFRRSPRREESSGDLRTLDDVCGLLDTVSGHGSGGVPGGRTADLPVKRRWAARGVRREAFGERRAGRSFGGWWS